MLRRDADPVLGGVPNVATFERGLSLVGRYARDVVVNAIFRVGGQDSVGVPREVRLDSKVFGPTLFGAEPQTKVERIEGVCGGTETLAGRLQTLKACWSISRLARLRLRIVRGRIDVIGSAVLG